MSTPQQAERARIAQDVEAAVPATVVFFAMLLVLEAGVGEDQFGSGFGITLPIADNLGTNSLHTAL